MNAADSNESRVRQRSATHGSASRTSAPTHVSSSSAGAPCAQCLPQRAPPPPPRIAVLPFRWEIFLRTFRYGRKERIKRAGAELRPAQPRRGWLRGPGLGRPPPPPAVGRGHEAGGAGAAISARGTAQRRARLPLRLRPAPLPAGGPPAQKHAAPVQPPALLSHPPDARTQSKTTAGGGRGA